MKCTLTWHCRHLPADRQDALIFMILETTKKASSRNMSSAIFLICGEWVLGDFLLGAQVKSYRPSKVLRAYTCISSGQTS